MGKSPARAKALQPAQVRSYWCRKIPLNNEVFFPLSYSPSPISQTIVYVLYKQHAVYAPMPLQGLKASLWQQQKRKKKKYLLIKRGSIICIFERILSFLPPHNVQVSRTALR